MELRISTKAIGIDFDLCLNGLVSYLVGRCIFHASGGYVGLGPAGSQQGDTICILLGCKLPVVLRPSLAADSDQTWQVVGICSVPGLMKGEALYPGSFANRYKSVQWGEGEYDLVDGYPYALQDLETGKLRTDPAELLEEAGIKVESYQRRPHRLEVLPETLRAAGINLTEFTLV